MSPTTARTLPTSTASSRALRATARRRFDVLHDRHSVEPRSRAGATPAAQTLRDVGVDHERLRDGLRATDADLDARVGRSAWRVVSVDAALPHQLADAPRGQRHRRLGARERHGARLGGAPSGLGLKTTWNLLWTWSKPQVERKTLLVWQKVNHFKQAKALTRKDCLKRHLGKYAALGGRLRQAFDIAPLTFLLPQEYVAFVQAFHDRARRLEPSQKNIWIMKPVALSRGAASRLSTT
ncbi:hypothetical protein PINS_up016941 [Pythium insidiosum]|nr:hypothetical protein PINS_up016941 [Pythium insidiosum]